MHMNIEHLFIEFLGEEDRPVGPGMAGRIVVTDLMNRAMPLIRYQVEDMGVPVDRRCSCGRGLPLLEKVTGRMADFLLRPDGSRVAGVSLIENTLTKIPGIEQMTCSRMLHSILVNAVVSPVFNEPRERELKDYFTGLFGSETNVLMKRVATIPQEKGGKYRFSICKIDGSNSWAG